MVVFIFCYIPIYLIRVKTKLMPQCFGQVTACICAIIERSRHALLNRHRLCQVPWLIYIAAL